MVLVEVIVGKVLQKGQKDEGHIRVSGGVKEVIDEYEQSFGVRD